MVRTAPSGGGDILLSRVGPRIFGGSPLLLACAMVIREQLGPEDVSLAVTNAARLRERPGGSTVDPMTRELEARHQAYLAGLPTVRWRAAKSRLELAYIGDLDDAALDAVTSPAARAVLERLLQELRRIPAATVKKLGGAAERLTAAVERACATLPVDDDELRAFVAARERAVMRRSFRPVAASASAAAAGEAVRLAEIRVYAGLRNAQPRVHRLLWGAELEGGIDVASAGPFLRLVAAAFERELRARQWLLPGFACIYLAPDDELAPGTIAVYREELDWLCWVEIGTTLDELRALCRGDDLLAVTRFVQAALVELARAHGLDASVVDDAAEEIGKRGRAGLEGLEIGYPPMYNRR